MSGANKPDIARLLELQRLLHTFSNIERVIHRSNASGEIVRENDTEHSYNLALSGWFLAQYFPHLDINLVVKYALIHDLVEVHAGDTYIYADPSEIASKVERERAALERIEAEWHDFPDIAKHIHEYETRSSPEACFVYALDKIMPIMTIYVNNGITWIQEDLTLERLKLNKEDKVSKSPEIMTYYSELMKLLEESPELIRPR